MEKSLVRLPAYLQVEEATPNACRQELSIGLYEINPKSPISGNVHQAEHYRFAGAKAAHQSDAIPPIIQEALLRSEAAEMRYKVTSSAIVSMIFISVSAQRP